MLHHRDHTVFSVLINEAASPSFLLIYAAYPKAVKNFKHATSVATDWTSSCGRWFQRGLCFVFFVNDHQSRFRQWGQYYMTFDLYRPLTGFWSSFFWHLTVKAFHASRMWRKMSWKTMLGFQIVTFHHVKLWYLKRSGLRVKLLYKVNTERK